MIRATRHTGLVVRDLERALAFYEALGLTLWRRQEESGQFIECVVGFQGARIEWAKLQAPDGSMVELLQYWSHPSDQAFANAPANRVGCSHIAFTVDDVMRACALIQRLGGSVVNSPAVAPDGKVRVAYCHDLDGILMELVEELVPSG